MREDVAFDLGGDEARELLYGLANRGFEWRMTTNANKTYYGMDRMSGFVYGGETREYVVVMEVETKGNSRFELLMTDDAITYGRYE